MFRNFMKDFEDDPFFSGMPSMNFGMPSRLEDGSHGNRRVSQRKRFEDPFGGMFHHFEDLEKNMNSMMSRSHEVGNGGHSFCSSSVMTYRNDGKSKPQIYQATSSTRRAPGQIKETRRSLRDSERGIEKMAVGHHIGNRGRVLERRRIGGQEEEEKQYIEMGEDDEPNFDNEWKEKTSKFISRPSHENSMNMLGKPKRSKHQTRNLNQSDGRRKIQFK